MHLLNTYRARDTSPENGELIPNDLNFTST